MSTSKSCSGLSKQTFPSKVNFEPWMSSLLCKYCKKPGHSIDKCYRFHSFPSTFKFTRRSSSKKVASHAEVASPYDSQFDQQMSTIPGLNKEQHSQLILLLQQSYITDPSSASNLLGSANFAGKLLAEGVTPKVCLLTKIDNTIWIIDSGASDHMTSNMSLLYNILTLPTPYLVSLPNGYKVEVTNIESLVLFHELVLHNVLYIPSFQHNLISISKLVAVDGHSVLFTNNVCTF